MKIALLIFHILSFHCPQGQTVLHHRHKGTDDSNSHLIQSVRQSLQGWRSPFNYMGSQGPQEDLAVGKHVSSKDKLVCGQMGLC